MMIPKREIGIVLSYISKHKWLFGLNVLVMLIVSASEAVGIGMIIPILQSLMGGANADFFVINYIKRLFALLHIEYNFLNLMVLFVIIVAIRYSLTSSQKYLARLLNALVTYEVREKAFQNLMDLPLSYYYKQKIGDIVATLHTSSLYSGMALELSVLTFSALIISLCYIIVNSLISFPLTLVVCVLILISYSFALPRFKASFEKGYKAKEEMDRFSSFLVDTLGGVKVIKSFSNENFHIKRFQQINSVLKRVILRLQINTILSALYEMFIFFIAIALMVFAVQVLKMPIVLMITFFLVLLRLIPQVKLITSNYLIILQYLPHFAKVEDIIERKGKTYLPDGFREIKTLGSGIEFSHVYFRYPDSEDFVLKDVNLKVERNKITALVGVSGGGKTTVVDLILRLHHPDKGIIKVDGIDICELRIADWHKIIGVVHQDPYLFNDTIYNNILYGKPDATKEEVYNAAKMANAHDFILRLPDKYDTVVGERGMNLSGGEKQRIALARALIKNPEILILDEATSALDSESERLIKEAMARVSKSKTIIIIAHRISTVVDADKIIVIEDGEVAEEGTHEDLLHKEGVYRKKYSLQLLGA